MICVRTSGRGWRTFFEICSCVGSHRSSQMSLTFWLKLQLAVPPLLFAHRAHRAKQGTGPRLPLGLPRLQTSGLELVPPSRSLRLLYCGKAWWRNAGGLRKRSVSPYFGSGRWRGLRRWSSQTQCLPLLRFGLMARLAKASGGKLEVRR